MATSMGFWAVVGTACYPVGKVLLLCLVGAFLANHRMNKFPVEARKHMNHMVFMVFTPALVFINLGPAVTIKTLLQWWFMPFSVLLNSVIGFGLGHLVVAVTKPPPHLVRTTVACCTIGNMGNLPLVLITAICANSGSIFGAHCSTQGVAYTSYGMLMAVIVMWSFIYNYLESPGKSGEQHQLYEMLNLSPHETPRVPTLEDGDPNLGAKSPATKGLLQSDSSAGGAGAEAEFGGVSQSSHDRSSDRTGGLRESAPAGFSEGVDLAGESRGWREHWGTCQRWLRQLKWDKMFTPPVCGVICAIVVGGTDPLQDVFFGANAWLKLLTDVISTLAGAMIPCMMLVLGGNLAEGPTASEMQVPTMVGIGCVRLVFLPLLGIAVVKCADLLALLPPADPLFRFVLLLQFAMPTAINLGKEASWFGQALLYSGDDARRGGEGDVRRSLLVVPGVHTDHARIHYALFVHSHLRKRFPHSLGCTKDYVGRGQEHLGSLFLINHSM
ncbi:putative auxin efflux carrier family protein [Klebsormidium nitens]|uniref:Putative auxin efflux carrier family protein n=1 Tax=Klebsormidium nitens TaxID=105231 RepID=A0A1Y1IA21_KLENI|nr:putative auxin efflux carrier family protein [Klebsormidium nitens]|eukprot:GAQ87815.1 putative auxin efflux carrier family protein [Klebsormidium nitens]